MGGLGENSAAAPRTSSPRIWSFAGCVLDERSLELKVGGQLADLERKPLEVLLHLLRHAGEVVTKDELAEAVWPGRIITDSNLTKTMAVLRAALGDGEATVIKTVHGYGYRLMAPVSVQAAVSEPVPARFDFKPGESPPLRPNWQLEQRLGAGGHGEVWLAHHSKTKEPRVFKFAEAGGALTGLKREITLNRLLRETLPERDDYLRLLDWNLEQPPFFVESEYAANGSLAAWAEAQGGLRNIPLETRLEMLAQVADALAAAHSVGVLHKDLKPANILIVPAPAPHPSPLPIQTANGERETISPLPTQAGRGHAPVSEHGAGSGAGERPIRIKLADFGSGGVLDPGALEALGITRMGFTQTVHEDGTTSGTPLYLAPEVLAGQPFTVRSDIYALGVMLYQLVAADFRKSLAPGWEKDVADELLREDIAQTAAGNPADRLGDAALLAQRLRSLNRCRLERQEQKEREMQARRAQKLLEELRRVRFVAAALILLTVGAVVAGALALKSRNETQRANETVQIVNDFLNHDLLANANPLRGPTRELSARQLLDRAAENVAGRLGDRPEAAAQVHVSLGQAYRQLGELERARTHLEKAIGFYTDLYGPASLKTLETRRALAPVLSHIGRYDEACAVRKEVAALMQPQLSADDERLLALRLDLASCAGAGQDSLAEYQAVLEELTRRNRRGSDLYLTAIGAITNAHFNRGDLAQAEPTAREQVRALGEARGASHLTTARARAQLAMVLIHNSRLAEAETELFRSIADQKAWAGDESTDIGAHTVLLSFLRLEQGRFDEARQAGEAFLASPLGRQIGSGYRPACTVLLSEALLMQGRFEAAIKLAEETIERTRAGGYPRETHEIYARAYWADALMQHGRAGEAQAVLDGFAPQDLDPIDEQHTGRAIFRRTQGLLRIKRGELDRAREALSESLQIYRARNGPDHWRTKRATEELARIPASS